MVSTHKVCHQLSSRCVVCYALHGMLCCVIKGSMGAVLTNLALASCERSARAYRSVSRTRTTGVPDGGYWDIASLPMSQHAPCCAMCTSRIGHARQATQKRMQWVRGCGVVHINLGRLTDCQRFSGCDERRKLIKLHRFFSYAKTLFSKPDFSAFFSVHRLRGSWITF